MAIKNLHLLLRMKQVHDALAEVKLSYKANSANSKTVKLSEGLNFTCG